MASPTADTYDGQTLDDAVDLLARIRHLGLLTDEAEARSDIAGDVDTFIETVDHTAASAPRCDVCGHLLELESWDTPVLYCRNGCDLDDDTDTAQRFAVTVELAREIDPVRLQEVIIEEFFRLGDDGLVSVRRLDADRPASADTGAPW